MVGIPSRSKALRGRISSVFAPGFSVQVKRPRRFLVFAYAGERLPLAAVQPVAKHFEVRRDSVDGHRKVTGAAPIVSVTAAWFNVQYRSPSRFENFEYSSRSGAGVSDHQ